MLVQLPKASQGPWQCRLFTLAMLIALSISAPAWAGTKTFKEQIGVGKTIVVRLPGKPKMGYSWHLNKQKSSGLERVSLQELGWSYETKRRGSSSFTKPGILRQAITAKASGATTLFFEYFRKEKGSSPSAIWVYKINIVKDPAFIN